MKQHLAQISILVNDYDEAIQFYTQNLGFVLMEDTVLSEGKRWVRVAPPGSEGGGLLLAKAANEQQENSIGNQCGGRVFLSQATDGIPGTSLDHGGVGGEQAQPGQFDIRLD